MFQLQDEVRLTSEKICIYEVQYQLANNYIISLSLIHDAHTTAVCIWHKGIPVVLTYNYVTRSAKRGLIAFLIAHV